MNLYKNFFKRAIDITASGCGLLVLSPLLAVVTVWLHFANKGAGAFFFQERPGKDEKIFKIVKFKSMTDERDADGNLLPDADRLTKIGRFIRATSIDELPQLWNVFIGDMSLIGPRPLLPQYLGYYTERERLRHTVRPGITGWAQVHGRNTLLWNERLEHDAWYVEHLSFWIDFKIIMSTIKKVINHDGVTVVTTGTDLDVERKNMGLHITPPIHRIRPIDNKLYVLREDMIPYSFGGNKARKARYFLAEMQAQGKDCIVTYGSSSSNHCRVIANIAASEKIPCHIISPQESSEATFNSRLMAILGAKISSVPVDLVHETIESKLSELQEQGMHPYFIPGGGHGNLGTQAYVDCYKEIMEFEKHNRIHFDYIFLASGTGTTQAGLVCGQLINNHNRKIVGISIARKNPKGRQIIIDSIKEYLLSQNISSSDANINKATIFLDDYTGDGYGATIPKFTETIHSAIIEDGIPLDKTYTGKAFAGMLDMIERKKIKGKTILFIHTGGTPLFFDSIKN